MAADAASWRSSVACLCVLLGVLSAIPWWLVTVSGQATCLSDASLLFLNISISASSYEDPVVAISPIAAFDMTPLPQAGNPHNLIDNNTATTWIPALNSQNNYGVYFQFAADGISNAYLVVGYSITVPVQSSASYTLQVGISQQATNNINQTQEVATIVVPQGPSMEMTSYVWVKNPFISDGASIVGVFNAALTSVIVAEVRFYVVPVIPFVTASDPRNHSSCHPLQNVQSSIDGTGLSYWNPCSGGAPYTQSLTTYSRSGTFQLTGVLLQTIFDGAHAPTQMQLTTGGQNMGAWGVFNTGLPPAYVAYYRYNNSGPVPATVTYGTSSVIQYYTALYQPLIRQFAIMGTGTPQSGLTPVYSPSCVWSNSSIYQFYARYNAPAGVVTHTLAWNQASTDALFNFWLTAPVMLHQIPSCFPYPYLPAGDTTAASLFSQVAPGSAPSYAHQWPLSAPIGLDQAWGVGCNGCSGTQLAMYNYLNSFAQARATITGRLQRDLSVYWETYYTNRVADITAITDFFDGPDVQYDINTFVLIQKEINALASAKDSPLGIITDVLGVIGAAVPGLGVLFSSLAAVAEVAMTIADVATGVAAAVSTASTLSTLGQDIASGSGLSSSSITTPFEAIGGAGYLLSPIACQSGACTNDLYFGQMLQEVTAQSTAGAEAVSPFIKGVLANYGQTMFYNAWYQGYDAGYFLYPTSVLDTMLQNEAKTSASWQAALGVRAMQNAFTFGNGTNGAGIQYCYVNLISGTGYTEWSNSSWNGLRSVFSSSPLGSAFWLSSPPTTVNGGCSGTSDGNLCYANCNQMTINQLTKQIVPNALVAGADSLFQTSIGSPTPTSAQTLQCTYS